MRRMLAVLVAFLPLAIPARAFAKADISRITIKGADLKTPIEITDPKTLANFDVWTGPGTSWTGGSHHRLVSLLTQSGQKDFNATKCCCTRRCRMSD